MRERMKIDEAIEYYSGMARFYKSDFTWMTRDYELYDLLKENANQSEELL